MEKLNINQEVFLKLHKWLVFHFGSRYENISLDTDLDFELKKYINEIQVAFFPDTTSIPLKNLLKDEQLNRILNIEKADVYEVMLSISKAGMLSFYLQNLQKIIPVIYRNHKITEIREYFRINFEEVKRVEVAPIDEEEKLQIKFKAPVEVYRSLAGKCINYTELLSGKFPAKEDFKIVLSSHAILLNALDFLAVDKKDSSYDVKSLILRDALLKSTTKMTELFAKLP